VQANSQLLSCGLWGDVTVWSVNEMSEADVAGTSEVDFGLRVGGRVRLLKNSALLRIGLDAARPAHRLSGIRLQCTRDVCLLPRDNNQVTSPMHMTICDGVYSASSYGCLSIMLGPVPSHEFYAVTFVQFVVAADGGRVLMGARYGEAPAPKVSLLFCPADMQCIRTIPSR
jgi:hypothetical protein